MIGGAEQDKDVNELVVPPDEQTRVLLSSTEHSALMLSTFALEGSL